jgi:hypothetical protein
MTWRRSMTRVALGVTTRNTALQVLDMSKQPYSKVGLDVVGLAAQPARHRGEVPGGEHIDEGVVGHVTDRRRPGLGL